MSFLDLNGLTVPIAAESGGGPKQNIGKRKRAWGGTLRTSRRERKEKLDYTTAPMLPDDTVALDGIVAGLGHSWPFDHRDSALLTPDFFGSKGETPGSSVGSSFFGTGADGAEVVDVNGVAESKYGTGSIGCEAATTNLLTTSNKRDFEEGTTGLVAAGGASIAVDTTNKLQGSQSLKVTTAAINDGARTSGTAEPVSSATAYTASVYIKTTVARNVRIRLDDNDATNTPADFLTVANKWMRLTVTHTTGATASAANMRVLDRDSGGTIFYTDAWQLEAGTFATAWADATRAAGNLTYPATVLNQENTDLTINVWVRETTATSASTRDIIAIYDSLTIGGRDFIVLDRIISDTKPALIVRGANVIDTINWTSSYDGAWHMLTVIMRNNPAAGQSQFEVYFDGVQEATKDGLTLPVLTDMNFVDVGNTNGGNLLTGEGRIDALSILPYAATQAQMTAWAAMTETPAILPRMRLSGDVIPEASMLVEGLVVDQQDLGAYSAGTYIPNYSKLHFSLDEV